MRTRNWIAVMGIFVFVAAAIVVGQNALATAEPKPELELNILTPVVPAGGLADLEILVGPEALGGCATLYARAPGLEEYEVLTLPIYEPAHIIQAPIPDHPDLIGKKIVFQYAAYAADGRYLGRSKKADGLIVDPDVE